MITSNTFPTMVRIVTAAALVALAGAAQAGPVYDYTGSKFTSFAGTQQGIFSDGDRMSGWVEFDVDPVASGSFGVGNVVAFSLTDGHWTLSSANGMFSIPSLIRFQFDDDLNISQWHLGLIPISATGTRDMLSTRHLGYTYDISRADAGLTFSAAAYEAGSWSARDGGTVPEPGSLALGGLALVAAGLARRRQPAGVVPS